MNRDNFLKKKLDSGQAVIGTWSIIPSPVVVDVIANSGVDFIILDQEHGTVSIDTAQTMVMACESRGVSPILRVGGMNESDVLRGLDIGMHGIQVPNVHTVSQAKSIPQMAKYPPMGNRGLSPFTRAGGYCNKNANKHSQIANINTLVAINIESNEAINDIDEMLTISGLDIFFVGLFDLSKSLGIPGEVKDPRVIAALRKLTNKISKAGKVPGTITTSQEDIPLFLDMGLRYIVHLVDCAMLKNVYSDVTKYFRQYQSD